MSDMRDEVTDHAPEPPSVHSPINPIAAAIGGLITVIAMIIFMVFFGGIILAIIAGVLLLALAVMAFFYFEEHRGTFWACIALVALVLGVIYCPDLTWLFE